MKTKKEWLQSKDIIELSEIFKSLSHPSRIAIMFLLCKSDNKKMTVKCIYKELKMAQPVISRHLGILKNSGLVQRVTKGQDTFYQLNEENKHVKHISNYYCQK